jgi:hypothetical protein
MTTRNGYKPHGKRHVTLDMRRGVRDQIEFVVGSLELMTDTSTCSDETRQALRQVISLLKVLECRVDAILRGEEPQEEHV